MKCRPPCRTSMLDVTNGVGIVIGHACPECGATVAIRDPGFQPPPVPVVRDPFRPLPTEPQSEHTNRYDPETLARMKQSMRGAQARKERPPRVCALTSCGAQFVPKTGNQLYCVDLCRDLAHVLRNPPKTDRRRPVQGPRKIHWRSVASAEVGS